MMTVFVYFPASEPHWNRKATTQWAFCVLDVGGLRVGNFAHGVVKAQAQDLDEEVDGVAGQAALRPPPVAVFDGQIRIGGQLVVLRFAFEKLKAAPLQERNQRGRAGGADQVGGGSLRRTGRARPHTLFLSLFSLPKHPNRDIWQLTPRGWKETFGPKAPAPLASG